MTADADETFARFRTTGEPRFLAEVFDATAPLLLRVARHCCPDTATAEDAVQATFVTAIEAAQNYRPGRPVRGWLLGILHNHLRRRARRERRPLPTMTNASPTPFDEVTATEVRRAVATALAEVPMALREVLDLRLLHGLSTAAIAGRLQRPAGTVRTQVHRGIVLLRRRLPRGLVAPALLLALSGRGLAAVRGDVLRVASPAPIAALDRAAAQARACCSAGDLEDRDWLFFRGPSRTQVVARCDNLRDYGPSALMVSALMAGGVAVKSLFVIVCVAIIGLLLRSPEAVLPQPADAAAPLAPDVAEQQVRHGGVTRIAAQPPATATMAAVPPTSHAALRAATILHLQVVDETGTPVPFATVECATESGLRGYDPEFLGLVARGLPVDRAAERAAEVRAERRHTTAQDGRLALPLTTELVVLHACEPSRGSSGRLQIPDGYRDSEQVWRVVLRPPTYVHGAVVDARGDAVAGARVEAMIASTDNLGPATNPDAVDTDAAGQFVLPLAAGGVYYVHAERGDQATDTYTVPVPIDEPLTLRMAGAFSLRGNVVDPHGRPPGAGSVQVWELVENLRRDFPFSATAVCDGDGRFTIRLSRPGRYLIVARGAGCANARTRELVIDDDNRHLDVTVALLPAASITGRVVDATGQPVAGALLVADFRGARTAQRIYADDLFGKAVQTRSDADGRFALTPVHADAHYVVTVFATDGPLRQILERRDVAGGSSALVLCADGATGNSIVGAVVDAASGAPLAEFTGELRWLDRDDAHTSSTLLPSAPGRFVVDDVGVDRRCHLTITAAGYAPVHVAELLTLRGATEVRFALQARGHLACRVVHADGTPAINAEIAIVYRTTDSATPGEDLPPQFADDHGSLLLPLASGRYSMTARLDGASATTTVDVTPVQTVSALLRLSR